MVKVNNFREPDPYFHLYNENFLKESLLEQINANLLLRDALNGISPQVSPLQIIGEFIENFSKRYNLDYTYCYNLLNTINIV